MIDMERFHLCAVRRRMFDYIEAHPDRSSDDMGTIARREVAEAVIEQGIVAQIARHSPQKQSEIGIGGGGKSEN